MADRQLVGQYENILRAGYRRAAGEPLHEELEAAGEESLLSSAERLAAQLEDSVLDAPWLRPDITGIVDDWLSSATTDGEINLNDLRGALDPLFGPSRSLMIARTEAGGAYNGAMAAGLRAHGWGHVEWLAAPDACDECTALDGQVMTIAEYENEPLQHPNCSCTCEPWEAEGEDVGTAAEEEAMGE